MFLIMDFIEQSPQISFHHKIDLIKIIFSSDISPTPYHSLKNWPLSVSWTAEWLCGTAVQNTEHILQDLTAGREWREACPDICQGETAAEEAVELQQWLVQDDGGGTLATELQAYMSFISTLEEKI